MPCSSRHSSAVPALVDLGHQVRRRLLAHALERGELRPTVERVEVGVVVHEARGDELIDQRLAQALDVHRAPRREVQRGRAGCAPGTTRSRSARRPRPRA